MSPVGIHAVATYLPERVLSNDELVDRFDFDRAFIEEKLGISERRIAAPDESCSDVAVQAAELLFAAHPELPREEVGALVLCTQNPDYRLPHTSAIVQQRLGLAPQVAAFDVNLGCSGFVYSLAVAKSLMEASGMRHGLIITADLYSKIIDPSDRATMPLFGDAASAVWIGEGGAVDVGSFTFGTDGAGYRDLIVERGGVRSPIPAGGSTEEELREQHLVMNGRAIFEFMASRIPDDIERCLSLNDYRIEEIDYFLFHQASAYMVTYLRKKMAIPEEKVPVLLRTTGNTVSSTIPMALEWLMATGRAPGSKVLVSGFGVGLSWASTILTVSK